MKKDFNLDDQNQEAGETQLFELIKEAGNEARTRKQKAMTLHFHRLQTIVEEVVSRKQDSVQTL